MRTPPQSSHSCAPLSHHFMAELPGMNNSNVSMPRARVYLEMRAHTTATQFSNLPFNANARFTWKLKLQAMKRRFFFSSFHPHFLFFWGGGYQLKLLSYFTTTLEEITASEWAAQIIDSMLKPSLGALSSWPGSCLQCTQGSSELITPSLPLCSSNHLSLSGCTLSFLSLSSPHAIAPTIYHT